ncbi:MAG: S26 family signal peptidase, partial [Flavitalea sp.]
MYSGGSFFKSPIFILLIVVLIIGAMITLRQTYVLQTFSFNSYANSPTIPAKHTVFTSILKKPGRFDFIAFRNNFQPGAPIWMSRVCGMPGDSIEIKKGSLFVNGHPVDSLFTLSHSYLVFPKDTI